MPTFLPLPLMAACCCCSVITRVPPLRTSPAIRLAVAVRRGSVGLVGWSVGWSVGGSGGSALDGRWPSRAQAQLRRRRRRQGRSAGGARAWHVWGLSTAGATHWTDQGEVGEVEGLSDGARGKVIAGGSTGPWKIWGDRSRTEVAASRLNAYLSRSCSLKYFKKLLETKVNRFCHWVLHCQWFGSFQCNLICQNQGRRHEVLIFFGGDGFIGSQAHLPPKFNLSFDFGHFISKMLENAKMLCVTRKKRYWNVHIFRGSYPAVFKVAGVLTPAPPPSSSATPLVKTFFRRVSKSNFRTSYQFCKIRAEKRYLPFFGPPCNYYERGRRPSEFSLNMRIFASWATDRPTDRPTVTLFSGLYLLNQATDWQTVFGIWRPHSINHSY